MPSWLLLIVAGIIVTTMENNIQLTNEVTQQEYITIKTQMPKMENSIEQVKEKIVEKEKETQSLIEKFMQDAVEFFKEGLQQIFNIIKSNLS